MFAALFVFIKNYKRADNFYFAILAMLIALYSIFQIFTIEGWNEIPAAVVANAPDGSWFPGLARLFFVLVVLLGGIFGFSILNAVFVDEMVMDNNDLLEQKMDQLNKKVDQLLGIEPPTTEQTEKDPDDIIN